MARKEHRDHLHLLHFCLPIPNTTMSGCWPSKKIKPNPEATPSRKKMKLPPPDKTRDRPYLNVPMARAIYRDNVSVGVHDIHLPGGCLLNVRRVLVPPMSCQGRETHDEIRRRQATIPHDLQEDPTFSMDSIWWNRPAYKPCPRFRSCRFGDDEYHYDAPPDAPQQVP
jgi:hypothetical protein